VFACIAHDALREPSSLTGAASETEIQWDEAVAFLRRRLGYELPASARPHLDDLVQESLVRLLRAVRREPVDNSRR
jgi:DNA-directed RNA polymerase specialized sigma24 family protein